MYQTDHDTRAENEIGAVIQQVYGFRLHKLAIAYSLDFGAVGPDNLVKFWCEVKARTGMQWGQYPTVMLSMQKLMAAIRLWDASGLPVLFFVRDADGDIRQFDLMLARGRSDWVRWGGRTRQTRDSADIEPVAMIPIELFEPLGTVPYPWDPTCPL
jgi:hypothetical protein